MQNRSGLLATRPRRGRPVRRPRRCRVLDHLFPYRNGGGRVEWWSLVNGVPGLDVDIYVVRLQLVQRAAGRPLRHRSRPDHCVPASGDAGLLHRRRRPHRHQPLQATAHQVPVPRFWPGQDGGRLRTATPSGAAGQPHAGCLHERGIERAVPRHGPPPRRRPDRGRYAQAPPSRRPSPTADGHCVTSEHLRRDGDPARRARSVLYTVGDVSLAADTNTLAFAIVDDSTSTFMVVARPFPPPERMEYRIDDVPARGVCVAIGSRDRQPLALG